MAITTVKPFYLDANGVYQPVSGDAVNGNKIAVAELQISTLTTANGVLQNDANGNLSTALIDNDNVAAAAAIAGTKISPNFGAQNVQTTGTITGTSFSGSGSGLTSIPAGQLTGNIAAIDGSALTNLTAANLTGSLPAISGSSLTSLSSSALSGNLPALDGSALTNLSAGNLTGTLPAISGANLTNLNANNIASGTVDTNRIAGSYTGITGLGTVTTGVWQGTAINDTYLATISTPGKVNDAALSSNVALLNRNSQTFSGTSPEFSNALTVGAPTLNGHAATKLYVDTEIAAVSSGLDYKQEAKWYWNLADNTDVFSEPNTVAGFLAGINGAVSVFSAGDRILLNNASAAATDVGIYVFGGSAGSYTLARSSDFANGAQATGAWIYCLNTFDENGAVAIDSAYVCNTAGATVNTTAIQFILYSTIGTISANVPVTYAGGVIGLNVGAGLTVPGSGGSAGFLTVSVDGTTIELNGSNAIGFKSLPSNFKIDGVATSGVTASDLNLLTGGTTSNGATQHRHASNVFLLANTGSALTTGKAVVWNGTTLSLATNVGAGAVAGLVVDDPNTGTVAVANSGVVRGVGPSGSPSIGDNIYVLANGALGAYASIQSGEYVTKVGRYLGTVESVADCVSIQIQEFGIKP